MSCKRLPCWTLGWPASSSQSSQRLFCRWALGGGGDAGHTWWHRYAEDKLLHITTIEPSVVDVGKSFLLNLTQNFTSRQILIPSAATSEMNQCLCHAIVSKWSLRLATWGFGVWRHGVGDIIGSVCEDIRVHQAELYVPDGNLRCELGSTFVLWRMRNILSL